MRQHVDNRKADLAKIHIAKKALQLDDETYRTIVRSVGGVASGSSADLDRAGRACVLQHLKARGWRARRAQTKDQAIRAKRVTQQGEILASEGQVGLIRSMWITMADAGAVKNRTESGLRRWIRSVTRRYHPDYAGYSAPEFLPDRVAQRVIEHLKHWGKRCNVRLDE